MTLRFAVEPFAACQQEIDALGRQHWAETEEYRHGQRYNPDWKRYLSSDAAGWYFVCTARPWDSCVMRTPMVGYGGMWVMPSMHTQQMVAMEDFFFLEPDYRKGWNAIKFLKFIEAQCRQRGAIEIGWTDKKGKGALLEHLGYEVVASQWSKQFLGGADSTHAKLNAVEAVNVYPERTTAA
jgi:GNAT superfamily N-acetyltransferase